MNDAHESKHQSDIQNIKLEQQQMTRIGNAIKAAIKKGLYECMIYETIRDNNKNLLSSYGYSHSRMGGRQGENNYLLKWPAPPCTDNCDTYTTYYPGGVPNPHYPL